MVKHASSLAVLAVLILVFVAGVFFVISSIHGIDVFDGKATYVLTQSLLNDSASLEQQLQSVDFSLVANVQTSMRIVNWSITGIQNVGFLKKPETKPEIFQTTTFAVNGSCWNDGENMTLGTTSISVSQIKEVTRQRGTGDYALLISASLNVHVVFSDGHTRDVIAAPSIGEFFFAYNGSNMTLTS